MKRINMLKKIIIYSFYLFLFFFVVYLVYFINTQDPYKKSIRQDIKSIIKKNTLNEHLFNDYREQYLPDTQFIKVNYKKIDSAREHWPFLRDRRIDFYKGILKNPADE